MDTRDGYSANFICIVVLSKSVIIVVCSPVFMCSLHLSVPQSPLYSYIAEYWTAVKREIYTSTNIHPKTATHWASQILNWLMIEANHS